MEEAVSWATHGKNFVAYTKSEQQTDRYAAIKWVRRSLQEKFRHNDDIRVDSMDCNIAFMHTKCWLILMSLFSYIPLLKIPLPLSSQVLKYTNLVLIIAKQILRWVESLSVTLE